MLYTSISLIPADGLDAPTGNCSEGWYCTGGSYMAEPVTTDNATDLATCTCPLANYTGGKCWPGTYCPSGTVYPLPCTYGWYCDDYGLATPKGLCDPGYYCDGNASEPNPTHRVCPAGYYCEQGSGTPTACPAGTMSDTDGNVNITNCEDCTPGYYCAGNHNTNVTGNNCHP